MSQLKFYFKTIFKIENSDSRQLTTPIKSCFCARFTTTTIDQVLGEGRIAKLQISKRLPQAIRDNYETDQLAC